MGMSNVKWSCIWLGEPTFGAGSVPSIQSTEGARTLSTSCRAAVSVTVGAAGGAPAGLPFASAPTKFSHLTNIPGFVAGTVTGTVRLTFPVKGTPLAVGKSFWFAFGSQFAIEESALFVFWLSH